MQNAPLKAMTFATRSKGCSGRRNRNA